MRLPTSAETSSFEMNMTPMIDVIFQLLIFFLCTSNFMQPEKLLATNLSLPGSIQQTEVLPPEMLDLEEVFIEVKSKPELHWIIAQVEYQSWESVAGILKALSNTKTDLPVLLEIDPDVPLGKVIDIYDLCKICGLAKVQFAADLDSNGK